MVVSGTRGGFWGPGGELGVGCCGCLPIWDVLGLFWGGWQQRDAGRWWLTPGCHLCSQGCSPLHSDPIATPHRLSPAPTPCLLTGGLRAAPKNHRHPPNCPSHPFPPAPGADDSGDPSQEATVTATTPAPTHPEDGRCPAAPGGSLGWRLGETRLLLGPAPSPLTAGDPSPTLTSSPQAPCAW